MAAFSCLRKHLGQHFVAGKVILTFEEADEVIKLAENEIFSGSSNTSNNSDVVNSIDLNKTVEELASECCDALTTGQVDNTFYEYGEENSSPDDFDFSEGSLNGVVTEQAQTDEQHQNEMTGSVAVTTMAVSSENNNIQKETAAISVPAPAKTIETTNNKGNNKKTPSQSSSTNKLTTAAAAVSDDGRKSNKATTLSNAIAIDSNSSSMSDKTSERTTSADSSASKSGSSNSRDSVSGR